VLEYAKQISNTNILFTDADIFWLKNPLPLVHQEPDGKLLKFYCSSNTGVWYFDKTSEIVDEVFRKWKFIISRVLINDSEFFNELSAIVPTALERSFQDEVAFGYLICRYPELYNPVVSEENYMIYRLMNDGPLDNVKCLHALGAVLGSTRGLICLVLKELKESIQSVLNDDQIRDVFSGVTSNHLYGIDEIKSISDYELKKLLEFTGSLRADELINELRIQRV